MITFVFQVGVGDALLNHRHTGLTVQDVNDVEGMSEAAARTIHSNGSEI